MLSRRMDGDIALQSRCHLFAALIIRRSVCLRSTTTWLLLKLRVRKLKEGNRWSTASRLSSQSVGPSLVCPPLLEGFSVMPLTEGKDAATDLRVSPFTMRCVYDAFPANIVTGRHTSPQPRRALFHREPVGIFVATFN